MINIADPYEKILLTIAIPTFNRAIEFEFCLHRIIEEVIGLPLDQRSLIKIYVSDNASTDSTPRVIERFKLLNFNQIQFSRNSENIGADRNISSCYDSATSSYVWVFGDDDVILPGSLQKVLNILMDKKTDILYVNNYWFQGDYADRLVNSSKQGVFEFEKSLTFVRRTNVMLTFISGLIVRSGVGFEYRKDFLTSNLVQLSWIFPLLRDGKRFAVIEDFVVAAKGSNSGGYELFKVFGNNLKSISVNFFGESSKLVKVIESGVILNFFPDFILHFRRGENKFLDENMGSRLFDVFKGNWKYYFFLVPLIYLPFPVASFFAVCLRIFRRIFRGLLI